MYPNAFLNALWRTEILDQVFVAMSFEDRFKARFENVVRPAIESEPFGSLKLHAYRVDNSLTGDSILSDIVDGIAHSRLILADVSVIDEGRYTETPIRNGNVMYEVGVAPACRASSDVLLIRDDSKKFLFDVSTIPHKTVDFSDEARAIEELRKAILDRISESKLVNDARVRMVARALTQHELRLLRGLSDLEPNQARDLSIEFLGQLSFPDQQGISGLIQKGCIRSVAENTKTGTIFYSLTPFGYALADLADTALEKFTPKDDPRNDDEDRENAS